MSARLEHKTDKDKTVTTLFIDSEDGKTNLCILKFPQSIDDTSWEYYRTSTELQLRMYDIVKAINKGMIKVVGSS